jgi:molybdopterin-containing oxidoreductase family membrane subunit
LYSGVAAVITAMAIFRRAFHLQHYLQPEHFRKLGLLLLTLCLAYLYFTVNEYIGSGYATQGGETSLLAQLFRGTYTLEFWTMVTVGMLIPGVLLALPATRNVGGIVTASVLVNIGMWIMRYIIVVPPLSAPFLPTPLGVHLTYVPTWVEWSITAGTLAGFCLLFLIFSKLFPIISIWELTAPASPAAKDSGSASLRIAEGQA